MLVVPIYVLSVKYLSAAHELLLSPFFAFYCLLAMVGALFPDVDWAVDRVIPGFGHRNPVTHSLLLPLLLYVLMLSSGVSQPILVNSYNAFTLGIATHLLGDVIRKGNLTWIKSRRQEYAWYVLSGIVLTALLYLTGFLEVFDLEYSSFFNLFS